MAHQRVTRWSVHLRFRCDSTVGRYAMLQAANITNKWANYGIEKVRYSHRPTHIDKVKVWTVGDDGSLLSHTTMSRDDVIRLIGLGLVFKTITAIPNSTR